MSKTKYYFDKDNLEFIPIKRTNLNKSYNLLLFLISSIIFGGFITVLLLNTEFINTPQELIQSREIKNYELQMKVLNKKLEQVESTLANIEKADEDLGWKPKISIDYGLAKTYDYYLNMKKSKK